MVEESELFDVAWTPDFTEDVFQAVEYIEFVLCSPIAAKNTLAGIRNRLEKQRVLPTAAASYIGSDGSTRYIISYGNFDIHYVIEEMTIKAIGLKHQLQGSDRETLPREQEEIGS